MFFNTKKVSWYNLQHPAHSFHPGAFTGYCHGSSVSRSLQSLCASIESDSPLYFIYRTTAGDKNTFLPKDTETCPFRNVEYAFSYSTRGGAKVCGEPSSKLDSCIEKERMVFQFQACPDVPGSERTGIITEVGMCESYMRKLLQMRYWNAWPHGKRARHGIWLLEW